MLFFHIVVTGTQVGQAIIAIIVAGVGYMLKRQQNQIHVLVNSRLTDALKRIALLEGAYNLKPGQHPEEVPTEETHA